MKCRGDDLFMASLFAILIAIIVTMIVLDGHRVNWCHAHGYDWTTVGRGQVFCTDTEGRLIKSWSLIH